MVENIGQKAHVEATWYCEVLEKQEDMAYQWEQKHHFYEMGEQVTKREEGAIGLC